ncbi:DUF4296 domain-containing protein [uncultured Microscilla sp.]|uniref:DUF4296 domain-containing protein n=1 Tax=uncultured Microscilla sp. TaxID=432653 RepID=UPI00260AF6D6|nr:DUF4296 domain-containing protein [uncultured Microscilla sp.]
MKNFIYTCIVVLIVACSNKKEIPKDIIPKEKMVNMLVDIHLEESKIDASRYLLRDSAQVAYFKAQVGIFKKYKTDSTHYYKSYDYYFENMNHMKDIYTEVAEKMKAMSDSVANTLKDSSSNKKKDKPKKKTPKVAKPMIEVKMIPDKPKANADKKK